MMYSKFGGTPHRPFAGNGTGSMSRAPSYRQKVRVPPNYSGHTIIDGEEHPFGEESSQVDTANPADALLYVDTARQGSIPAPRFEDLPRVSDLTGPHRPAGIRTVEDIVLSNDIPSDESPDTDTAALPAAVLPDEPKPSARRPSLFDAAHFPFGHGFGFDEILLLGLILFLLYEDGGKADRGDLDETLILLGLLLLCG